MSAPRIRPVTRLGALVALALLPACSGTVERATSILPLANAGPGERDLLNRVGAAADRAGNPQLASVAYGKAAERAPGDRDTRLAFAFAALKANKLDDAERAFGRLNERGTDTEAAIGLARVKLARQDYRAAASAFEAILETAPDERRALLGGGVAYDGLGEHRRAQALYRRVLASDPHDVSARNNYGLSLALGDRVPEAIEVLRTLAQSERATARTRQNLALALALAGEQDTAREVALHDLDGASVEKNLSVIAHAREGGAT